MYLDGVIGGSCPNDIRTMPAGSTRAAGIYNDSRMVQLHRPSLMQVS